MKSVNDFARAKQLGHPITMITCYDYTSAMIVASSDVDCILVGDSSAMVMHGHHTTTMATMAQIEMHTAAVSRAQGRQFLIADLPFMSTRKGLTHSVEAVERLIQAGAQAVKLEGAEGHIDLVAHTVSSGVPVMGHLGLTPQHVNQLGGHRVQGRTPVSHHKMVEDALKLQQAGCFALVLECVPVDLATEITQKLKIPTIGIGAGNQTDGQVLVFQDLLGLQNQIRPRFVKQYVNGADILKQGINVFVDEVVTGQFPTAEQSYEATADASH